MDHANLSRIYAVSIQLWVWIFFFQHHTLEVDFHNHEAMPAIVPVPKFVKSSAAGSYFYAEPSPLKSSLKAVIHWSFMLPCREVLRPATIYQPSAHFTDQLSVAIPNLLRKLFLSNPNFNYVFATSFCTCHDSTTVMVCTKICSYAIVRT